MNKLYFNNKCLWDDFNSAVLNGVEYPVVEEIVENIEAEGNTFGNLIVKTGIYKDLIQEVKVRLFDSENKTEKIALIKDWLSDIRDNRLFFDANLNKCLHVKAANIIGGYIKSSDISIDFTIRFECEPFYYDSEIRTINWNTNETLKSDTMIPYEPIIYATGTGEEISIIINEQELKFSSEKDVEYVIDCEREYVYKRGSNIPIRTKGNFFKIVKGNNKFESVSNNTVKIKLKNRYWG